MEKNEDDYKELMEGDILKKKLCKENGVKLIYYSNLGIEYPYEVIEGKEKLIKYMLGD